MKILGLARKGTEEAAGAEVKEILGISSQAIESGILFDCDIRSACALCYQTRALRQVVILKGIADHSSPTTLARSLEIMSFPELVGKTFSFRCEKAPGVLQTTAALERMIGGEIQELTGSAVDLERPEIKTFGLITSSSAYIGIDLCGFDLGKRDYNIFGVQRSIKGDIAYSLFSCVWEGGTFLDPFSGSGMVAIEAALFLTKTPPHFYAKDRFIFSSYGLGFDADELFSSIDAERTEPAGAVHAYEPMNQYLQATKKNAKIAGIDKSITFSRVDTDWLDGKFEEGTISAAASVIPGRDDEPSRKAAKTLLANLSIILIPGGKAAIMGHVPGLSELRGDLTAVKTFSVWQGKTVYPVTIFQKDSRTTPTPL